MRKVINGLRYDTETAIEIASDRYWDGSNMDRRGRNCHLYKTRNGNYFSFNTTRWQGELDYITPLSKQEAQKLYEELPVSKMEYDDVFGIPKEA